MTLSPGAKRFAKKAFEAAVHAVKAEYRAKLLRIEKSFSPALTNVELSAGLELRAPAGGRGLSDVGRFVSDSPRMRRSRPDSATRSLIDQIVEGKLMIAAQDSLVPGAPRQILICEAHEVPRLAWDWTVVNVAGKPIPERLAPKPVQTSALPMAVRVGGPAPAPMQAELAAEDLPPRALAGRLLSPVGLGCMRLSTAGRAPEAEAIALVHTALEAGVRLFDTADSYCLNAKEAHHNERLLRAALEAWDGPREEVLIATKAGLIRPGGRWLPDGRPAHLKEACERSLEALGVERIELFQLHARHNRVPFADSVGALAELKKEGKIAHVGLCNVSLAELEEALGIVEIASVQNKCNPFEAGSFKKDIVQACRAKGIAFVAHSPLGGFRKVAKVGTEDALRSVAARHGVTPHEVALAWLLSMSDNLFVTPGATRPGSVRSSARALRVRLSRGDQERLSERFPWSAGLASPPPEAPAGEVAVVMGCPASGKSSRVAPYLEQGYTRLNRDELGGTLDGLLPRLREEFASGARRFVLDNTYPTRKSRAKLLRLAREERLQATCVWLDITAEEALYNAAKRVLAKLGTLPSPDELKAAARAHPNLFPPYVIYAYLRKLEPPTTEEGFASVERVPFVRRATGEGRALLLDMDGTLRMSRGPAPFPLHPDEVELLPGRKEVLARHVAEGWRLFGVSNQSGIAREQLSAETAEACFARTAELLELDIPTLYCPHPSGAIACWCRKPMPGMGVRLIEEHGLDRERCLVVGDLDSDRQFARNLGVPYADAGEFFGG